VLPCFNAARFVDAALGSLRSQSFTDLEILAIDDGSTDGTLSLLEDHGRADGRVRVLRNEGNEGLIPTLNRGVAESRGELIARMDADDVAARQRIEHQVRTLLRRPDIDMLGSAIVLARDQGWFRRRRLPLRCTGPGGARFMSILGTPLAHMTLMGRAGVMRAHRYGSGPESLHTEDYELFSRMTAAGVQFANLDEPLVTVRVHPGAVSLSHEQLQITNFVTCSRRHLERTLLVCPPAPVHRVLVNRIDQSVGPGDLEDGLGLLDRLERTFLADEPEAAQEIKRVAAMQRADVLLQASLKGSSGLRGAAIRLTKRYGPGLASPGIGRHLLSKL
jgi:hypothetical protein